jgi:hypothetical protein
MKYTKPTKRKTKPAVAAGVRPAGEPDPWTDRTRRLASDPGAVYKNCN